MGAAAFTVVAWASAFVVIRFVAHDVSPGALSLGRLVIGSVVLSGLMIGKQAGEDDRPRMGDWSR